MAFKMDDYVDVAQRIADFYERFPDGSLRSGSDPTVLEVGGKFFIVYHAQAWRTPDDPCPSDGWAWEPIPGPTPYTKDSELMNAETSAWGRAIVALGFATKKIASAQEVRNRQPTKDPGEADGADGAGSTPAPEAPPEDLSFAERARIAQERGTKPTKAKLEALVKVVDGLIADGAITAEQVASAAKVQDEHGLLHWPALAASLNREQTENLLGRLTTFMANRAKANEAA